MPSLKFVPEYNMGNITTLFVLAVTGVAFFVNVRAGVDNVRDDVGTVSSRVEKVEVAIQRTHELLELKMRAVEALQRERDERNDGKIQQLQESIWQLRNDLVKQSKQR